METTGAIMDIIDSKAVVKASPVEYLTFVVNRELYGIKLTRVSEIIRMPHITRVPHLRDYIKGVMNLRGKVIAVCDLRVKFDGAGHDYTDETCTVVIDIDDTPVGVIVDKVMDVQNIETDSVNTMPNLGRSINTEFVEFTAKVGDGYVLIIDMKKVIELTD